MSREVKRGDKFDLPEVPHDGPRTAADDPECARQKALAEEIMRDDREVLRELAK